MLTRVRFVLVNTSHPGNIGAVARAMKNMCLSRLVLVDPLRYPQDADVAFARASGAHDLLDASITASSLEEAIADCSLVIGTSARQRTVQWPVVSPRECGEKVIAEVSAGNEIAIVFGRENSGLTNAELALCHYLVHIPTNVEYSSLNVAMAAQVIAYELLMVSQSGEALTSDQRALITADSFEGFIQHLEQTMVDIRYSDPRKSDKLMRRLRRLFLRAELDQDEVKILRGILSAAQGRKSMRKIGDS